jgi:hypothetical protein
LERQKKQRICFAGCQKCKHDSISTTFDEFYNKAISVHNNKYSYDKSSYTCLTKKTTIVCPKHGKFRISGVNHLKGVGCKACGVSAWHRDIYEYIKSVYNGEILLNDRKVLPFEIDIYIPSLKFGVELHGLYWHSYNKLETYKQKSTHKRKAIIANKNGITLLQFFEHEWEKYNIVRSMISHHLNISNKIFARKTKVLKTSRNETINFFQENHIQGGRAGSINYALEQDGKIISCMSFNKHHKYQWEITRYANLVGTTVVAREAKFLINRSY